MNDFEHMASVLESYWKYIDSNFQKVHVENRKSGKTIITYKSGMQHIIVRLERDSKPYAIQLVLEYPNGTVEEQVLKYKDLCGFDLPF